jgi:hypothetical protein
VSLSRWNQGRAAIDRLVAERKLQQVPANRDHADMLIEQAYKHLDSAASASRSDPEGSAALLYDAARKALTGVLANQGLRATAAGGHLATYDAVHAQLVPPLGAILKPFDRLRRQRNQAEYPAADRPAPDLEAADLIDDIAKAREIVDACARILDQMPVY